MNKNSAIIFIVIIVLVAVGFAFVSSNQNAVETTSDLPPNGVSATTDTVGEAIQEKERSFPSAPTFSLSDFDGNIITNHDFEGKILVLNTWATWCPFCVDELPDFAKLQTLYPDDLVVIAINRMESVAQAQGYIDNQLFLTGAMTYLMDPQDSFYRSIGGFSMPESLFVDSKGNVRVHKRGPLQLEEMKTIIEGILNS